MFEFRKLRVFQYEANRIYLSHLGKRQRVQDIKTVLRNRISMEFCPICYKQTKKEIWKKENRFKESRWVFCPNHGYVKEDQQRTTACSKRNNGKYFLRIKPLITKGSVAIYNENNKIVSAAGRVLIMSIMFITISLCFILGYFVGTNASPPFLMYSVQVGAFSDASHAMTLKTLLATKGYKAVIEKPGLARRDQFYRVFIGKQSNRNSAKILSAKIKETEGIQAFVTSIQDKK